MSHYLTNRLAQAALVLWGAYSAAFFILYSLPSDPLSILLNAAGQEIGTLSPDQLEQARVFYGLDKPGAQQYFSILTGMLTGDFGISATLNRPVIDILVERSLPTIALALTAIILSVGGGVVFAYITTLIQWAPLRATLKRLPAVGFSIPTFWLGLLLMQFFAFTLGWLPATGSEGSASLILPAVTLAIPGAAIYAQVLIRGLETQWREAYVVTAFAKGLNHEQVQRRHVLINAAAPILTLVGLQMGNTVSGAVVVETIFARNGIGRLIQESVLRQDIPIVLATVVISAAIFVLVNLLIDLLYPVIDPRVSLGIKKR